MCWIVFIAALAGLLFGFNVSVISGAMEFIQNDFHVSDQTLEFIVSALLVGAVVGALIAGFFSNTFGRKKTLLLSGFIFIVGDLWSAFSTSAQELIAARFLLGVAVGMADFVAPLYLSETSPKKVRGMMISMYQLMVTIGIVLSYVSDLLFGTVVSVQGYIGGHWRWMLGIIVLPAAVMLCGVFFLPESPRWLFLKGFKRQGIAVFRRIFFSEEEVIHEIVDLEKNLHQKQHGFKLLRNNGRYRLAIFVGVSLQVMQQLSGINVVMYYAPRIFKMAGFESTSGQMWGTITIGIANVLATVVAIVLIDRLGRKPIMYFGFVMMFLSMVAVGILFNKSFEHSQLLGFYVLTALLVFILSFAVSSGPITYVICSEIFPLAGRDLGITFTTAASWLSTAAVGGTFLTMINKIGSESMFLIYGILQVFFLIFFFYFVPETQGVSLEHIEKNLFAGKPLRKIGR